MNELRRAADAVRRAARIAVFTGAGISAESGIPTFREAQTGLWERLRPELTGEAGAILPCLLQLAFPESS